MQSLLQGLLFSIGCLPVTLLIIWISKYSSEIKTNTIEDDIDTELSFNKDFLSIGEFNISESNEALVIRGTIENTSKESCGFIQLDGDIFLADHLISHSIGVIQNIEGEQIRGFEMIFTDNIKTEDINNLTAKVFISHAWNIDL